MFSALMMLGIGYNPRFVNIIAKDAYEMSKIGRPVAIILNNVIAEINILKNAESITSKIKYTDLLSYENKLLTSSARRGYRLLTAYILTAPCLGGLPKFP